MDVQYAMMVVTRKAGAVTDAAIGLYSSCLCLITGRPDYNLRISDVSGATGKASLPTLTTSTARYHAIRPAPAFALTNLTPAVGSFSTDGAGTLSNLIDNNTTTIFTGNVTAGNKYLHIDLGAVKRLDQLWIYSSGGAAGRKYKFDIIVSSNGSSWTTLATDWESSANPGGAGWTDYDKYTYAGGLFYRYVGVILKGNNVNTIYTIAELRVYGAATTLAIGEFQASVYASSANRAANTSALDSVAYTYASTPRTITFTGLSSYALAAITDANFPAAAPIYFDMVGNVPTSPPTNPISALPQLVWKEGLITKDTFGVIEESVDPTLGGGYSSTFGAELKLMNNLPGLGGATLFDYMRTNGIDMTRCIVSLHVIVDGTWKARGVFQIQDMGNAEHEMRGTVLDIADTIHKDVLKTQVNTGTFPDAPEGSQGKMTPLCIGRLAQAKMMPLAAVRGETLVGINPDTYVTRAISWNAGARQLVIKTPGMTFTANDSRLQGKFIGVVHAGATGGEYFSVKITANSATASTGIYASTTLTVSDLFRNKSQVAVNPDFSASITAWWFKIYGVTNFQGVSDTEIYGFTGNVQGWSESNKAFFDLAGRSVQQYPGADYTEIPDVAGALLVPDAGDVFSPPERAELVPETTKAWLNVTRAVTTDFTAAELSNTTVNEFPSYLGAVPRVFDKDVATGYDRTITIHPASTRNAKYWFNGYAAPAGVPEVHLVQVDLPEDFTLAAGEKIVVGVDFDIRLANQSPGLANYNAGLTIYLLDQYGTTLISSFRPLKQKDGTSLGTTAGRTMGLNPGTSGQTYEYRGLSSSYYGGADDGWALIDIDPTDVFRGFLANPELAKTAKLCIGFGIQYDVRFTNAASGATYVVGHTLKEIALFKQQDAYTGTKYIPLTGAKFGGTWGSRKSAANPVLSFPDTIEYLMRERDGAAAYVDTASFDSILSKRPEASWHLGRQIIDQLGSKEAIEDLAKNIFAFVFPGRDGKRQMATLDQYADPVATFDPSTIVQSSVGDAETVGFDRVYTGLELKYDKNPETGDYRSTLFVRKTDEAAFPSKTENIPGTNTKLWTTYAGGFNSYPNAKSAWDSFHENWLTSPQENIYEMESDWFVNGRSVGANVVDTPIYLALILSQWFGKPRIRIPFLIPLTSANLDIKPLDRAIFMDPIRTGSLYYPVLIESVKLDTDKDLIEIIVSRRWNDEGTPAAADLTPVSITEGIEGDTITEVIGTSTTITEVVN